MFTVEQIVNSLYKVKNNRLKRRHIFNRATVGGISSTYLKMLLLLSPLLTYGAIFNKASFEYLGIAQAIIVFIISLVALMQIVLAITYFSNKSLLKRVSESWEELFPGVELKMVLSSGATPYKEFIKHYEDALTRGLSGDKLHEQMKEAFTQMEIENIDLIEAMRRDKDRK